MSATTTSCSSSSRRGERYSIVRRATATDNTRFTAVLSEPCRRTICCNRAGRAQPIGDQRASDFGWPRSGFFELARCSLGGVFRARIEGERGGRRCLVDDVHHRLEQRQTLGREPHAGAYHHTVIGGGLERLLEHG